MEGGRDFRALHSESSAERATAPFRGPKCPPDAHPYRRRGRSTTPRDRGRTPLWRSQPPGCRLHSVDVPSASRRILSATTRRVRGPEQSTSALAATGAEVAWLEADPAQPPVVWLSRGGIHLNYGRWCTRSVCAFGYRTACRASPAGDALGTVIDVPSPSVFEAADRRGPTSTEGFVSRRTRSRSVVACAPFLTISDYCHFTSSLRPSPYANGNHIVGGRHLVAIRVL